jgi:hypothetical protein
MENQLIMEKENSVWTKTQLLVFYVVILLAIDEYVFSFRFILCWFCHGAAAAAIMALAKANQ